MSPEARLPWEDVTDKNRRRIDQALAEDFCEGLDQLSLDEVRERRDMAEEVERELSYYRRLFHGRIDLVAFEMRRRRGEESRSLIEALPEILASGITGEGSPSSTRHLTVDLDLPKFTGRRDLDHILEGDALTRVNSMTEGELAELQLALADAEKVISRQRRQLHEVIDCLQAEIIDRYKRGLARTDAGS